MHNPLLAAAVKLLLPLAGPTGPTFNGEALTNLILTKVVPAILCFIGVMMLLNARKQRMSALLEDVGKIVVIGVVFGASGLLIAFGGSLAKMIIN